MCVSKVGAVVGGGGVLLCLPMLSRGASWVEFRCPFSFLFFRSFLFLLYFTWEKIRKG